MEERVRSGAPHLHDVLDQRLVCADLGTLEAADVLADPGDEGELGPLAHGVARGDPHEAEKTRIVWKREEGNFGERENRGGKDMPEQERGKKTGGQSSKRERVERERDIQEERGRNREQEIEVTAHWRKIG